MPLTESFVRGAVTTTDRASDFHPEAWRSRIKEIRLRAAPMLAVMKSMGSEKTESFHYHWPVQPFAKGRGSVTDVLTADNTEYATGDSAAADGATLSLVMSEADAKQCIPTDVLTVINSVTKAMRRFYVRTVSIAGTSSKVTGILLQADTDKEILGATQVATEPLYFTITGNAQEELSALPTPLYSEPTWFENVTQNFMESMELSNREIIEKERVNPNIRVRNRLQAYQRMLRKKEWSYMLGKYKVTTGANGRRLTFTNGVITAIEENEPDNVLDFATDTSFGLGSTDTWLVGGEKFLDLAAEQISRTGESQYKTCYCGGLGVTYINQLVKNSATYQITGRENVYGVNVTTLRMPNQDWRIVEHPLFTENPAFRTSMLVTEKQLIKEKVLQKLKHIPADGNARDGYNYVSGIKEGYECDTGVEYENLGAMAWITNIGTTRAL